MSAKRRCTGKKKDGAPCQAPARPGSRYCFLHDPSQADKAQKARQKGGKERTRKKAPAVMPSVEIKNVGDVVSVLGETINQLREGKLDSKQANAIGYIGNVILKALEGDELARQLEELRRQVEEVRHAPRIYDSQADKPTPGDPDQPERARDSPRDSPRPGDDLPRGGDDGGPLAGRIAPLFR